MKITGFVEGEGRISIERYDPISVNQLFVDGLSGLHLDAHTGHLLLLSYESKLLAEVSRERDAVSYMDFGAGFNRLECSIPQAGGVTMDAEGNLYIVSEPNFLYRFSEVDGV